MLPPSIDRSDFGTTRLRELEEQQINLHHLCSAVLDDGDVDIPPPPPAGAGANHRHRFSPPTPVDHCDLMTGEVHSFSSSFSDEHFRHREFTPSPCNERGVYNDGTVATPDSRQGSMQNPYAYAGVAGGSTVNYVPATGTADIRSRTSPPAVRSAHARANRKPPPPPAANDDDDDGTIHTGRHHPDPMSSYHSAVATALEGSRRRSDNTRGATTAASSIVREAPAEQKSDISFQEAYRKYVLGSDAMNPRRSSYRDSSLTSGAATIPSPSYYDHPHQTGGAAAAAAVVVDSRSTSVVSTIRSTGKYVTGTAYKKYLTSPTTTTTTTASNYREPIVPSSTMSGLNNNDNNNNNAVTSLTLLPPPNPAQSSARRPPPPSATNTYQPSSRSVSEQSDYSNYSKTAATISKWRKVLYAGSSVHNNSQRPQDVSGGDSEWQLHGNEEQRVPPPPHDYLVSPVSNPSRSLSCVSGEASAFGGGGERRSRNLDGRELLEREEQKIKRYFEDGDRPPRGSRGSIRKEEEEWNVTTALNFVERRRRDGPLQAPAAISSAASSQYGGAGYFESPASRSMSLEHPYNDASPDGLVPDVVTRREPNAAALIVAHGGGALKPPMMMMMMDNDKSNESQEFFDEDPVRSFLQQRLSTNIPDEGSLSQKRKQQQHHFMAPPTPEESVSSKQGEPTPSSAKYRRPPSAHSTEEEGGESARNGVRDHASAALVPRPDEAALQMEVQKTRDKSEALARHLVRALEEKRKLQEHLAQMEHQMSNGGGLLVSGGGKDAAGGEVVLAAQAAEKATAGVQAALRTKERELAIYEEEIQRLNGLLLQQQEIHATTPNVVLAAQAAAAAEVDAAINEVGLAHLSQRKAEERADKLASELESAVNVIYTLDGRVAELQKAAMVQQMEEIRSTALGGGVSPDRSGVTTDSAAAASSQQALVELIRRAEGLLHQSDATSSHTAAYLQSLQHTCQELRRQLYEKGGEVEELQDQCNALRRDKNVLRLYGAQWLQQLVDVRADAEVIADIVHTSREDAERVVAGSLNADSLLNTSLSTLDAAVDVSQPIREYHSTSRQFAELVIHDMHAVARYLAALRRMNIGEQEGYTLLERLANGKSLMLLEDLNEEDDDDEPSLGLPEPARQLVQQKKQFVLDAVEEALRMRRDGMGESAAPSRHEAELDGAAARTPRQRQAHSAHRAATTMAAGDTTEEEADELVLPYPPQRFECAGAAAERESSPPPLPHPHHLHRPEDEAATPTSHTKSRERSTTAKPADVRLDSSSKPVKPCYVEERDEERGDAAAANEAAQRKTKKHSSSSSSRRKHEEEYDEPSLPFFGGSSARALTVVSSSSSSHVPTRSETTATATPAAAAEHNTPATLNATLPPRSASTTTVDVPTIVAHPPITTSTAAADSSPNSISMPSFHEGIENVAAAPQTLDKPPERSSLATPASAPVPHSGGNGVDGGLHAGAATTTNNNTAGATATSSPTTSRRGFSPESSFGVSGAASLPQLQRSATPSRMEGSGVGPNEAAAANVVRPTPRHANAGMMETAQPTEPKRSDHPPANIPTSPRASQNLSPVMMSGSTTPPPEVRHTASPVELNEVHSLVPAESVAVALEQQQQSRQASGERGGESHSNVHGAAPRASATFFSDARPIRISTTPTSTPSPNRASMEPVSITVSTPTHMFDTPTPSTTTQQPAPTTASPTLGDRLPIPSTTTSSSLRRHQLAEPARPSGVTDLPAPATGNPFGEMSQPAAPPGAPGASQQQPDPVRERRSAAAAAAAILSPRSAVMTPLGSQSSANAMGAEISDASGSSKPQTASPVLSNRFGGSGAAESSQHPIKDAAGGEDDTVGSSSLKLPPRPYTKPFLTAQQRAALRPSPRGMASNSISSADAMGEQQTPSANVSSTDSAVAEAMNLSPIVAQTDYRSTSLNSMPNGSSLESSTMLAAGAGHSNNSAGQNQSSPAGNKDDEAKRKENVAKILERLRAAKK